MALMNFGDFNDMFGHVDRMMNNIMRNMFNPMPDPFGMMDTMMPGLTNIATLHNMPNMAQGGSYFSSSVMHISNDGSGRPQVYQATQSARYGPDGVKETQESVRDSASGLQKMAIGHHINDRGHVIEKSKNWYTGEEEEKDDFINLDEEEGQAFEDEWKSRMGAAYAQRRGYQPALTSGQSSGPLAITAGPSTSVENSSSHYYPQQHHHHHQHQHQHQHQHHQHHHQHQHQHQHQNRHLHINQLPQHPRTNNQQHYRGDMNATNSRCDPDIEIISAPSRVQTNQQPVAGCSSPQASNRHRVSAKQRSKKDKKPYKRSSRNYEQQH